MNNYIRKSVLIFLPVAAGLLAAGCASTKQTLDCSGDPCGDAKAICAEAREARADYDRLPEEDRKEMISAVNTYVEHCEDAQARCRKCSSK